MATTTQNFEKESEEALQIETSDPPQHAPPLAGVSHAEGRKIIHKIDRRLISATGLMFAVSLMDRTNLGAANIAGMRQELSLEKGFRFVSDREI